MNFIKNASSADGASVPLTPLIDIIFLLIIFFLVSSTFKTDETVLGIETPETKGGDRVVQPESLTFHIRQDGVIIVKGEQKNLIEIQEMIQAPEIKNKRSKLQMNIRGDKRTPYEVIAKLFGVLKANGYRKIALNTIAEKSTR